MTIAAVQDLMIRFGEQELLLIADRDNDGVVDAELVAAVLRDADSEIISLVAGSVAIEAGDPPLRAVQLACDIARYRLYGAAPTEDVRLRYQDAVKFLGLVRDRKATFDGGAAAPTEVAAPSMSSASESQPRLFRRGCL